LRRSTAGSSGAGLPFEIPATTIRDEILRVTFPAAGTSAAQPAAPAELAALLAASSGRGLDEALARFLSTHTPLILRVTRSLGGDADAAMDRYAYVLERLREDDCRRLRAYLRPHAGEFSLWLIVVVRRLCLDHYRERYGRASRPGVTDRAAGADRAGRRRLADLVADRTDPSLLASSRLAPDEELAKRERRDALSAALEQLGPTDRLLLRLRFAEDLPAREIAQVMRFPTLFHVYRRIDKVLRELRAALGSLGVEPES
jgi:RNA polymerase sigma factor (sigma-70 family)